MSALDLFASALGAFILIAIVLFPYFPNISPQDTAALREELAATQQRLESSQQNLQDAQQESAAAQQQLESSQQNFQDAQQELATTQQRLESSQQNLQDAQQESATTQQRLESCQADLTQTRSELEQTRESLGRAQQEREQCATELRKKFLLILISWSSNNDDIDLHVIDPQGREFYYRKKTHPGTPAKLEEDNTRGPGNEIWLHPQATPGRYKIYYKFFEATRYQVKVRGSYLTPDGRKDLPSRILQREGEKPLVAIITIDNDGNATMQRQ